MKSKYAAINKALVELIEQSDGMTLDILERHKKSPKNLKDKYKNRIDFNDNYQMWYTEAHSVILQLLPERLNEFVSLYMPEKRRKELNALTYKIQDWMNGLGSPTHAGVKRFDDLAVVIMSFNTQTSILDSAKARYESKLFEIKELVTADIFDSELDSAHELNRKGFIRAGGAVAGVVLEKHLSNVCTSRTIKTGKKNPAISDYNDALKKEDIIEVEQWRFIQHLGDLRNLCNHKKGKEPTKSDVTALIDGVDKVINTIY